MLTVDELCAGMSASGRHLTPRAARDWWTKGLLPKPQRHGLGRAKGTETFWSEPKVLAQAQAAYDSLARHCRVNTTLLDLWLQGFTVDLVSIRTAYRGRINRHLGWISRPPGLPSDNVGELAAMIGRKIADDRGMPPEVQHSATDLVAPFLEIFFGVSMQLAGEGLAELWSIVAPIPYQLDLTAGSLADIHLRDDDLENLLRYLKDIGSLAVQRAAVSSATDYELLRARRLVHFVFGQLGRLAQAGQYNGDFEQICHPFLIVFGRPAVPILIIVLRNDIWRHQVTSFLLYFASKLPRSPKRLSLG